MELLRALYLDLQFLLKISLYAVCQSRKRGFALNAPYGVISYDFLVRLAIDPYKAVLSYDNPASCRVFYHRDHRSFFADYARHFVRIDLKYPSAFKLLQPWAVHRDIDKLLGSHIRDLAHKIIAESEEFCKIRPFR